MICYLLGLFVLCCVLFIWKCAHAQLETGILIWWKTSYHKRCAPSTHCLIYNNEQMYEKVTRFAFIKLFEAFSPDLVSNHVILLVYYDNDAHIHIRMESKMWQRYESGKEVARHTIWQEKCSFLNEQKSSNKE